SEEYLFLVAAGADDWIKPYVSGPCKLLTGPALPLPRKPPYWRAVLDKKFPFIRQAWQRVKFRSFRVPRSDGTIERTGISLMHFTLQSGFLTDIPSVYQPHDLQHIHLPELFDYRRR